MTEKTREDLPRVDLGILGGTGLYNIEGIEVETEIAIETPFGSPSDSFVIGNLAGAKIAFLSRHGRGHTLLPAEINYQANIYAYKMLGVGKLLSINSVGSLREEIKPRDVVIPDQFFDRSRRISSFFGKGVAAHVSVAEPFCRELSQVIYDAAQELGVPAHLGGTYVCIDGPAFSTKAESRVYRSWGCHVIGMTAASEAKLCREAEICYAAMNLVTDFDVWHESEEPVTVEIILENLAENIDNAKAIIKRVIPKMVGSGSACGCSNALAGCIVTQEDLMPQESKEKLRHLIEKYLGQ
ncbi:MAG: S-methyl-5'-thioadenosine phosphorylase [Candidatus Aminicenantes bacterium]|nr:S-methyl-5'-thioadenosine phosphorylase [Candidatus Aminicenantes bacterium]